MMFHIFGIPMSFFQLVYVIVVADVVLGFLLLEHFYFWLMDWLFIRGFID